MSFTNIRKREFVYIPNDSYEFIGSVNHFKELTTYWFTEPGIALHWLKRALKLNLMQGVSERAREAGRVVQ